MQTVAVGWHLYEMTGSAVALGLVGIAQFLPIFLFSMLGGISADKFNRKKILIYSQLVLSLMATVLTIATFKNLANPWLIYGVLFLNSTFNAFSQPARQSVIPHLVPNNLFMNAVSLNTLQRQSALVIGPAIGGLIIAGYGVGGIYLFNAVSFLFLILAIIPLNIPAHLESKKASFSFQSVMEGIRFVKSSPILWSTMVLDFLATFFGTATILMPIFAKDVLHIGAQGLGLLYGAPAIGGIVAGLILSSLHNLKNQGRIILISVFIYGLATIGFGLSSNLWIALFFLSLTGAGDMTATILRNTIRQTITPDHLRGRMVSVNMVFVQGGPRLGEVEAGLTAALLGAPRSVILGGIGTILITMLIAAKIPKLRKYQGNEVAV